jgi:hypothetical protein
MAKSYNKATAVSVYSRIRLTDGSQPYCPAIWETKKRLKPHWCLVHGTPEHHPEGIYHVRYRVNGKPIWEKVCIGDDPHRAADLAALRQSQLADPNGAASQRIVDEHKPEPVDERPQTYRIDDEVKTYLSNVEKLALSSITTKQATNSLGRRKCSRAATWWRTPRTGKTMRSTTAS